MPNIGPLEILVLLVLLLVLGVPIYGVARLARRRCPRCGTRVRNKVLDCGSCGYDFRRV